MLPNSLIGEEQGHHSGYRSHSPPLILNYIEPLFQRFPLGEPGLIHGTTHAIDDDLRGLEIAIGTGLTEVGDGGHHQLGIDLLQSLIIEPQPGHDPRTKTLHQDVHTLHQLLNDPPPPIALQVQGDAFLVGVEVEEKATLLGMGIILKEGPHFAGWIPLTGPLHLNHIGAIVSQQLGAVRARNVPGQIQHFDIR